MKCKLNTLVYSILITAIIVGAMVYISSRPHRIVIKEFYNRTIINCNLSKDMKGLLYNYCDSGSWTFFDNKTIECFHGNYKETLTFEEFENRFGIEPKRTCEEV